MFPYFYLPEDAQTGKIKLYKNEEEVWDTLKNINESRTSIPTDILWAFKGIVNKILSNRRKKGYHPLDFPIVRYFLHPDWVESNLPFVQHPDFIKDMRRLFGDEKTQQFFQEIQAELSYHFYMRIYSLRAVWECAKFLEKQSAKITEFHQLSNNGQGPDIMFEWNNTQWHGETKNLSHKDINLFCIAHTLAGIMYLKDEGKNLRQWNNITIEGQNIDDTFREISIEGIRKGLNDIFEGLRTATGIIPKVQKITNDFNMTAIQVNKNKIKVEIQSQSHKTTMNKVTLILQKWTRPNSIQNYYTISPCGAYFWPKAFTGEFYSKLDKVIKRIAEQEKSFNDGYFGFIYLDLHEENIDQRQKATEKQEWEPIIEQHLNQVVFPLVLVTDSTRLQKSFYIMNRAAANAGFKESHQDK